MKVITKFLLVLVFLGAVGFTGWYVWHSNRTTDQTLTQTNKSASSQSVTKAQITVHQSPAAEAKVKALYHKYLATEQSAGRQDAVATLKDSVTADLYTKLQAASEFDQVTCAQAIPTSATVSSKKTAQNITVYQIEHFHASTVLVSDTLDSSSLLITDISCQT